MRFYGMLLLDGLLALIVAHQVAFIHHLGLAAGLAVFALAFAILAGTDRWAARKNYGLWRRTGLATALFLGLYAINVASSLTRCDHSHQNCHRVFSP